MKLQTHCHILGGSGCAHASMQDLIDDMKSAGFDGAVITNHYCARYYYEYSGDTHKQKMDYYFSLIDNAVKLGEENCFKVFYGAEVRANMPNDLFAEYILYGYDRKLFYDEKPLFTYTQEQLFALCEENGIFMYQAHPFRNRGVCGNPKYMRGAEYFNGHFNHINNNDLARKFCEENSLIKMSGTDYHDKFQPVLGGIIVPDTVTDNRSLTECIFNNKHEIINDETIYLRYLEKKLKG